MGEFTQVLEQLHASVGRPEAMNALFEAAYGDLKALAHQRLRRNEPITFLDTTALVHESYMRFLQAGKIELADRAHFLAYTARVMRSVIVDFVRRSAADRRGGELVHVTFNTEHGQLAAKEEDFIRLDEALAALEETDPQIVRIVEMRFFAGLSAEEVADALGLSRTTLFREWRKARMVLAEAIRNP